MTKRKLPIGLRTFREVREEGCYYVDKTACAHRLADGGKHYFPSRPRRFGKSLFEGACKELFEGNEPLFRGLAAHDRRDWPVRHPVVRLDFSGRNFTEPGHLDMNLAAQLDGVERRAGVGTPRYPAGLARVRENIIKARLFGRLVAGDFSGAIVSAKLQEFHPNTGERLDYLEVADELERIRHGAKARAEVDVLVDMHVIGFAKVMGDVAAGAARVMAFFGIAFLVLAGGGAGGGDRGGLRDLHLRAAARPSCTGPRLRGGL